MQAEHYLEKNYITFVLGPDPHQQPQINLESLYVKLNSSNNMFNFQPPGWEVGKRLPELKDVMD